MESSLFVCVFCAQFCYVATQLRTDEGMLGMEDMPTCSEAVEMESDIPCGRTDGLDTAPQLDGS